MRHPVPVLVLSCLAAALASVPTSARAAESYDNCKGFIDTLPATINTQGTWCLRKDLNTNLESGEAIDVVVNNVTLDCNDFKIGNLLAGAGNSATGVRALDRSNFTVRNCNVRGFGYGVALLSSGTGNVIEDNRVDSSRRFGIFDSSSSSTIRRNFINDTVSLGQAVGIVTSGNHDILDNTIDTVSGAGGNTYGILVSATDDSTVRGNRVRTVVASELDALAYGIRVNDAFSYAMVADNFLSSGGASVLPDTIGIGCNASNTFVRDNVMGGFGSSLQTCFDDGGNVAR